MYRMMSNELRHIHIQLQRNEAYNITQSGYSYNSLTRSKFAKTHIYQRHHEWRNIHIYLYYVWTVKIQTPARNQPFNFFK